MRVSMYKKNCSKTIQVCVVFLFGMIPFHMWAQTPTLRLSLDKTIVSEAGGKATLMATLSAPQSQDVTVYLKTAGTAAYQADYDADFFGKGSTKIVAGGNGLGSDANQLQYPSSIFVDNQGNLFIADQYNHRIQKWAPGAMSGVTVAGGNVKGSASNQLAYPNSIFVDSQGNMFIADRDNHRVQKWAPGASSGVTVAGGNGRGSAANQLDSPIFVYVDNQSNLFIADQYNHRIQKWAPGASSGVTVAGGNGIGLRGNQLYYPEGIFVDNRGNIITYSSDASRIQKWTPGATSSVIMVGKDWINLDGNQLYYLINNVFIDRNGNKLYSDLYEHRIQKVIYQPQIVIPAGQTSGMLTLTVLDDQRFEDNELVTFVVDKIENASLSSSQPTLQVTIQDDDVAPTVSLSFSDSTLLEEGPATDLQLQLSAGAGKFIKVQLDFSGTALRGTHYTVDRQEVIFEPGDSVAYVQITPIDNGLVEPLKTITAAVIGGDNIALPYSVATIPLSSEDKPEVVLRLDRTALSEAGGKAKVTASLSAPHSRDVFVYFNPSGTAKYKEDYSLDIVEKTNVITVAGGNGEGSAANQFNIPIGIFVDSLGNLFIADQINSRIQKWAPGAISGVTVAGGNGEGAAANQLAYPTGIFVDSQSNVYIADRSNHRIQKWAPGATSGVTVAGGNGRGSAANQLDSPISVFVDSQSNVYIADGSNHRIQKWAPGAISGVTVAGGNGDGAAANRLDFPSGVFVDNLGNLFIVDFFNMRIQKWTPGASSGVTVAGGNGEGAGANQFYFPGSIFVDSQGNLYISDLGNHRIQKWAPGASSGVTEAGGNGRGTAANQLDSPHGVFVDNLGDLFIADTRNHRIQKVTYQPQVMIPAGQTSASFTMTALDDLINEEDEWAIFEISGIENGVVSPNHPVLQVSISERDSLAPMIQARDSIQVFLNAQGTASLNVEAIELGSTDNRGIASRVLSTTSFSCSQMGVVLVGYKVTNVDGNSSKKVIVVTVSDTLAPVLQTKNARLVIDEDGRAVLATTDVITSATDNCAIGTQTLSSTTFGCGQIGNREVTVTVTDVNGNKTEANVLVEIMDDNGVCPCSYSILAAESVTLINNRLAYGGVGTYGVNKSVRLENTRANKETVFIRSTQIEADETSRPNRLIERQAPQPFAYEQMSTSASGTMRVKRNGEMSSSEGQFGVIRVRRGGVLTLTSNRIVAERIIVEKGGQLNFTQKTIVGVAGEFKTESDVVINGSNEAVRVYAGKDLVIGSNNRINGYFHTLQEAELKRNRGTDTTRVSGTVVGNTVIAMGQVVWEGGVTGCGTDEETDNIQKRSAKLEFVAAQENDDKLDELVEAQLLKESESKLYMYGPNPATTYVTLRFYQIPSVKPVVQILQNSTRQMDGMVKQTWLSDQMLKLDLSELAAGMYLVTVRVDGKVQIVKIVKE
jgi:sugar lactone lactonase YvrE